MPGTSSVGAAPSSAPAAPAGAAGIGTGTASLPPNGVNVSNLAGAAGGLTPQQMNQAMQALNISPNEALMLQQQLASGVISPQEAQSLCAHLAASNINPTMVQTVAGTLGLSSTQLQQIQGCLSGNQSSQASAATNSPVPGVVPAGQPIISAAPQVSTGTNQPTSLIEQSYGQLDLQLPPANPSPVNLSQFGYSIFASTVSSFAPLGNVPVGPDYVLGPGDQLNIYEWGRVNQVLPLVIDRDGSIEIQGIEPLQVGGLRFDDAKKLIEGRVGQISNVNVHVTMGQLRTIQVLVVGAVVQPGSYTISPLSRVSSALIAAGGVSKIGSLRGIQLRRGNQVIKTIDYYKLLLRGDNAEDDYLQTNDIVFVPPIGHVVGVVGDIQRPAIYELSKDSGTIEGAIRLAAGESPFSNSERVQVLRADKHRRLVALDVPYSQLAGKHFRLQDGDLVRIFHMISLHMDVVQLTGNVRRPGEFQWNPKMTVSDLVKMGDGVAEHTYFKYALIRRVIFPTMRQRYVPVDLEKALFGARGNAADMTLEPKDELDIFNEDNLRQAPVVAISGEVQAPGSYALSPGMRLSDLLYMAGGLKNDADKQKIQVTRSEVVDGGKTRYEYLKVDYAGAGASGLTQDESDPLLLKDDQVYVTVASGWHNPWTVMLAGEVMRPGTYPIGRETRLSSLLQESGGFTPAAFPKGVIFTRQSVQQIEQQRLQEAVQQLSQGFSQLMMSSQVQSNAGSSSSMAAAMGAVQSMLTQAQSQQANGRMVVHVNSIATLSSSPDDVILQNGDSITIPPTPASVNVLGLVNEPSSITAQPGWTVKDYLYRAGGPSPYADSNLVMVIKADGSVLTQSSIDKFHTFPLYSVVSGGLMGIHLEAGDTIYVPADVETFIKARYWVDITTVIANAAQSLAIVGLMAKL